MRSRPKVPAITLIVLTALFAALACDVEQPLRDSPAPNLASLEDPGVPCDQQIIPDPSCPPPGSGGGQAYEFDSLAANANIVAYFADHGATLGTPVLCPRTMSGSLVARVANPVTGYLYEFNTVGTWIIDWFASSPYYLTGQAIYNWPQPPGGGGWPAFNLDYPTGIARISVQQARGVCSAAQIGNEVVMNISFIRFYGVRVDDPQAPAGGGGGGGGGGGSGGSQFTSLDWDCYKEIYSDGTEVYVCTPR